jgi:hypothetical protein
MFFTCTFFYCVQLEEVQALVYSSGLNIYNLYGPCVKTAASGLVMDVKNSKLDVTNHRLQTANFGWAFSYLSSVQEESKVLFTLSLRMTGIADHRFKKKLCQQVMLVMLAHSMFN